MVDINPDSPPSSYLKKPNLLTIARQITDILTPQRVLVVGDSLAELTDIFRQQVTEATIIHNRNQQFLSQMRANHAERKKKHDYDLVVICVDDLVQSSPDQIKQAIAGFCEFSKQILLILEEHNALTLPLSSVQLGEVLAQQQFIRNLSVDLTAGPLWAALYQQITDFSVEMAIAYEHRMWELERANYALRQQNLNQLEQIKASNQKLSAWETRWALLEGRASWRLAQKLQQVRLRFAPPGSVRDQLLEDLLRAIRTRNAKILITAMSRLGQEIHFKMKLVLWQTRLRLKPPTTRHAIQIAETPSRPPVHPHQANVDIIVCVHNALEDVQRCLESVEGCTDPPYSLILIDDGSDPPTQTYLAEFASAHQARLFRNEKALGYTKAANQGLRQSSAEYVILLNSDTLVTEGWLDRLIACADSDPRIGMVGPLSNTASWQSIPAIEVDGDWAANPLPNDISINEMGKLVACYSARLYPEMPFLNGFCLLIRQQLLQEIGYFDEERFGTGYGEENDYALRGRQAGWRLALADDTYIYHAQSRSYSRERRQVLSEQAGIKLAEKHGSRIIKQGTNFCRYDRVLQGIRARSRVLSERQEWLKKGQARFAGKRLLFVLPIFGASGGGHVVIDEAKAMRRMGVEVNIFNLIANRQTFEQGYPNLDIPVVYGEKSDLVALARQYDAISATTNTSVEWLAPISQDNGRPALGYYVQEFEPYVYSPRSADFKKAWASYTLLPDLIRYTKTEWTRQEVKQQTGVDSHVVGVSLNLDQFQPRPRSGPDWPERPLRVVAMVRPRSPHRQARLTMDILRRAAKHYGNRIEVTIFGVSFEDPRFAELPRDFAWNLAGLLTQPQVASLLNETDIFVDFSSHQAMGLTALEAMASGSAVIVPARGGATSFARHEENSLVIDTSSPEACWLALQRLIDEQDLRSRLQSAALVDVCRYYPEQPAFKILSALCDQKGIPD
jgi:GT2 family glycosyltransferase/glycosyltransferase involved in cell wall biosynthesis